MPLVIEVLVMRNPLISYQLAVALASVLFVNVAPAADEQFSRLKIGDVTYTNAIVTSKTATHIILLHKGGIASFKLKNLEPDLQKQFGFDAEKAAAEEKKRAEDIAAYNEARAALDSIPKPVAPKQIWAKSILNQTAPDLVLEKWLSAAPETEGKFVLLTFWITSSEPCQKTIPLLNHFHRTFGNQLIVIALSDEPEEVVRSFAEPPVEFYSAIDSAARTRKAVEVRGVPHSMLIDPAGIVRWEGFPLLNGHTLDEQIICDALEQFTP